MILLKYEAQPPITVLTIGTLTYKRKNGVWLRRGGPGEVDGWYNVAIGTDKLLDEILKGEQERNENA